MTSFSKLVESAMKGEALDEKSPPGFKGTAKAMKKHKEIDNPYALSWWMKNKGMKSHRKADGTKKEAVGEASVVGARIEHPVRGSGVLLALSETTATVLWDNLQKRIHGPEILPYEDAKYISILDEQSYSSDPRDAEVNKEKKMKKHKKGTKKKVDEAMAAIPGTYRGETTGPKYDFGLTFDDLLEDGDSKKFDGATSGSTPRPADTLLTKNSEEFKSSGEAPLSTLDGADSETDPHFEDGQPDDAPDTPKYKELQDPGKGNVRKTGSGGEKSDSSKGFEKFTKKSDDDASDSDDEEPKKEEKKMSESHKKSYRELTESMTFEEMDMENSGPGASVVDEHDMAAGEIAVTQEFLVKLMSAAIRANLGDDKLSQIAQAVADCCTEDRTLDVGDIGMVMSKLKGGDAGADEAVGAEGDGEPAGPEGGPEHEGKTKLMACDGGTKMEADEEQVDECGDEEDELQEFASPDKKDDKKQAKNDKTQKGGDKKGLDESIVAMGMAAINGVDRGGEDHEVEGDDEAQELAMIKRRAGLDNWWK